MSEANAPLLSRRRLDDESPLASSHNLVDRHGREDEYEEEPTEYGSGVYRYPPYLQPGHFTSLEKLMFFSSSILLILLFIFAGLYARSSQQDNHAPSLPTTLPKSPKNHTAKQVSCLEPNCIITAAHILQDVDQELNPCDDFYSYTCNKWISNHLIPDVKSRIDILTGMTDTLRRRLDQILSRDYVDTYDGNLLPDPNAILDRQLFSKIQDFYLSCMDQDAIEKKSISPLYPLFRSIREFIPISNNNQVDQHKLNEAIQFLGQRNVWPLFQIEVVPDIIMNPTKPSLSLGQGQVGLPDKASYDNPEIMKVYMQVVTDVLDHIFKMDTRDEFGWKSWSAVATARRIVEFEKKIVQALTDGHQPERWSVKELQDRVPQIYWNEFIETLPEPPTHILIPHATFIENLSGDVLTTTNPRTLQMYFIWRTIWKYLDVLGEKFVGPKRKLDAKLSGIEPRATPERWETCIDIIDHSAMGVLLGRYFVTDHHQHIVQSKQQVESLTKSVVKIIHDRIPHLDWVAEESTRTEIQQKLNTMEFQVGFSTSKPNILSAISLSEYFSDVSMDRTDFFHNMIRSNKHQVKQQVWNVIKETTIDKNSWKMNAQSVQVSYNKELNKVMIPGGLLQLPFIDSITPGYFYYGTIGWMIGHEMMHAFDSIGNKYNSQGIYGNWWDDTTQNNLDVQNQCLINQYNQFGTDGRATLNNNFADGVGLYVVEALLKNQTSNKIIPGLNTWNKDQLAYIQFARMKCSKSTREHKLLVKDYAPDRYRVNGPLMNSDHFAATFNCKKGSVMNPEIKKCQLW
ncbi:hypothetical protein MFLAVUS_004287 [Mucor flavus]|uniref:Endothelin-converting enzyme 1 n=1 Tax=Mucor flavus TaxID=439312 RepID=A0ABP9YVJ8_9FUNG